jgi:hypothetical protein
MWCLQSNTTDDYGFPIAKPESQVGLDIPLKIMCALGGVLLYTVDHDGGIILKGFSTLFVPIKHFVDSVQWHFHHTQANTHISAQEIEDYCQD